MKTEITRENLLAIATEIAVGESNRVIAQRNGAHSSESFWENRGYGLKVACGVFLGVYPAAYMVENVERPYIVVAFDYVDGGREFRFDALTFELIA
jgi:hypothetical protein